MDTDKDLAVTLGNAARQARKALQLTQARVAEQLDVSVEFYSRIERGLGHPSIDTFVRMLSVLAVSADTLFGFDAAREAAPEPHALTSPADPPEVRRLVAALRTARPSTLRLVGALLNEFDRVSGERRRARRLARAPAPELAPEPAPEPTPEDSDED
jgi:transcriptional regulator with XRE-family HTH domain